MNNKIIQFNTIKALRAKIAKLKSEKKTIGFVPTMGALHDGHVSLIQCAKKHTDIVIVSIFVNPIQFGANEDFSKYPRNLKRDKEIISNAGCKILFTPSRDEMYKDSFVRVHAEKNGDILCGKSRKGHFDGVLTVVSKLFNIVSPDSAFFGEKDFQQLFLIKKLTCDLNFNIKIISCPIIRERDGVAMSSRNAYLSSDERQRAGIICSALEIGKNMLLSGIDIESTKNEVSRIIQSKNPAKIEYIEILDEKNLQKPESDSKNIRIFTAVLFGRTRLIDNVGVKIK